MRRHVTDAILAGSGATSTKDTERKATYGRYGSQASEIRLKQAEIQVGEPAVEVRSQYSKRIGDEGQPVALSPMRKSGRDRGQ